ncbi:MAG: SDR family oxidoreductase [Salinisphaeraceae bacterium]|nr:SDR family oxidoreductase [Salinisphaeraceae bacterium]
MTNLFDLTGRVALISGASRGIGEEAALLLAGQGAHVIVSSRKPEGCEPVAEKITAAGGKASVVACHVGNPESIDALIDSLKAEHDKLDILVNNAAANPYFGHILDTPLDALQKTIDVNLRGYFYMSQKVGQWMRETGGGVMVNTASINGVNPGMAQGIYSVTKGAIINMTKAFAKECAPQKIRVNAVLPGLTDTKFASALTQNDQIMQSIAPKIPMGRAADPSEIAPAILYLASDASSYMTGSCVTVDGGFLVGGGL